MYAKGSVGELRSQLFVLREAGILEESKFHTLWENALKLSKSIEGFRIYLREFDKRKTNL
jgi:four helix bundle protein